MKCTVLALLFSLAVASATQAWTPGREYVYEYKTRTMTGIPYLKNQVSGLGLRSKVIVQVKSPSELLIKMTENGIARAENQEVPEGWNKWRKEIPLTYSPLDSENGLSIPFKAILRDGKVESIETSSNEPIWTVNIKRALASQLSVNVNKIKQHRTYTVENEITKDAEEFYTVEEEPSVSGECKTHYTVVPLPEYIARTEERDIPEELKNKNQERKAYIITKTKDFTYCKKKPYFVHSSTIDKSEDGSSPSDSQHKRFSSRTSVSRYLIRGEPSHKFVVERVWTEGEFTVRPFATNTESILIASNQTLVLKKEESQSSPIQEPSNLVRKSLVFELGAASRRQEREREEIRRHELRRDMNSSYRYSSEERSEEEEERNAIQRLSPESEQYPKLNKAPSMLAASGKNVPVSEVKQQIKDLLNHVERLTENPENLHEEEPQLKVLSVSEALKVLNLEEIEELYREISSDSSSSENSRKTKKSLYFDAAAMAGTNPCWMFIKDKIQKRELRGEKASQILMVIPVTVKTPTPELLRELVDLCKEVKSYESKQLWYTSLLSMSTLINKACIDSKSRRHSWSSSPHSHLPYCTPEDVEILLPYLKQQIHEARDQSEMVVLVQAIGNLGSQKSFELLRPIVDGKVHTDKQIRSKAIFALSRVAESASKTLRKAIVSYLKPIYASPSEPTEVRLSAFVSILNCHPSEAFFTEAATSTWFEPSQQVGQFVYKTLESMANCTYPTHRNVSRMAAMALPLAKRYELGAQYSQHQINTHMIPERRIGSTLEWAHFSGKHSIIPEHMYVSLKNHMGGFDVPLFESSIQSQGIQTLINRLFGPENRQELPNDSKVSTRRDLPSKMNLWFKFMGNMERIITVDTLREWAKEGIVEYSGQNIYTVNYQKTLPLQDIGMVFPAESGHHMYLMKHSPLFVSIRGTVEVDMNLKRMSFRTKEFPQDAKLKLNLKPVICLSHKIEAGIAAPLTKEVYVSGHKTSVSASLPGKMQVIYRNKEIEVIAERQENLPAKVELFVVKSTPYTGFTKFFNFQKKHIKEIKVRQEPIRKEMNIFKKSLGLALESKIVKDSPYIDFAGLYDLLKPHSFLTASQYFAIPHTLRKFEYSLKLDLSKSDVNAAKARFIYSTIKKQFSFRDTQEEENMERYYKSQKPRYFSEMSEKCERFFSSPENEISELVSKQYSSESSEEYRTPYSVRSSESRRRMEDEYTYRVSESTSEVKSLHAELSLEGNQPRKYRSSLIYSKSADQTKQKLSVLFERESTSELPAWYLRASAQVKYPLVPVKRNEILNTHMKSLGHFSVKYGTPEKESQLHARLVMSQSAEWRQQAETSSNAQECFRHEQEGAPYSPACQEARREAQALNKAVFEVEADNTPNGVKNMTYHLNDFVKAYFYPHMTNKHLEEENPSNKVKIVFDVKPVKRVRPYQVLDVYVYKPKENTFLEAIKMSPLSEAFLPLSAGIPMNEKAFNKIMGYQYTPACELSREHITTFDNVTYRYPLSECYHLIAKDCSKQIPVEVLAKQDSEGKKTKINVGPHTIEIKPERRVQVNGENVQVQLHEEKVYKNKEDRRVLVVSRPKQQKLVIEAPLHGLKVLTDGKHIQVQMSNMFRGRTCGLCGDMNSEKVAEFKDPKECVRTNPIKFAKSYIMEDNCPHKNPRSEQEECHREYTVSSSYNKQHYESQRSSSGIRYSNKVVPREERDETCFSVKPVPECALGYRPTSHDDKMIGFHCVHRGRMANEMISRSRNEVLEELFEKPVDFEVEVAFPESCEKIRAY